MNGCECTMVFRCYTSIAEWKRIFLEEKYETKHTLSQLSIGKIKATYLPPYSGWYIIFKYDFFDEDQDKLDMDITPQEFIDKFNRALSKPSIFSTFYDK